VQLPIRTSSAVVDRAVTRLGIVPFGCIIGVLLLLAAGSITWHSSQTYGYQAHAKVGVHNSGAIPVAAASSAGSTTATKAVNLAISPTRIEIPKLHATAPIIKVGTTPDRELDVPQNPLTVGWWSPGARPGAVKGTAILAGHINYAGVQGALGKIGNLDPGDRFTIDGSSVNAHGKKSVEFRVTGVRTYHKTRLPYAEIFDQSSVGRVVLVTCGGPFDNATGNYLDNIVVFAVPVDQA